MGLGGVGIWQLLIVLAIVIMIFGTKRIKQLGGDIGGAIRGVREGFGDDATLVDMAGELHEAKKGLEEVQRTALYGKQVGSSASSENSASDVSSSLLSPLDISLTKSSNTSEE